MCEMVFSVGFGPGLNSMPPARSRRSASHAAGTHGWLPQKTGWPGLRRGEVGGNNLHSLADCGTPTTSRLALFYDIPKVLAQFYDIPWSEHSFIKYPGSTYIHRTISTTNTHMDKRYNFILNHDKSTCTLFTPDTVEYNTKPHLQINNTTLPMNTPKNIRSHT